jgi:hypothetical protein
MNENQRAIFGSERGMRLALESCLYIHGQKYPKFKEWAYIQDSNHLRIDVYTMLINGVKYGDTFGKIMNDIFDAMDYGD